jgi:GT2 family glycosyltransferase
MGQPLVAVVVVSWNGLQDTLACLTALRRLAYTNRRTVLVDNGSRDRTAEVVRRHFPEVRVIANPTNKGYVQANNQGIEWGLAQSADWILLLNNDVIAMPGTLRELIRVGESAPDAGIVGPVMQRTLRPDILDLGGDLDFRWGRVLLRRYTDALGDQEWLPIDYVWGCALMARREVFEQVGLLNPVYVAYFEDGDLCMRARRSGFDTLTALRARVTHQVGRSGEKRFAWQTYYRMRNHVLFFLRFAKRRYWPTLIPSLLLFQLPFITLQTTRAYLARKIMRRKYAHRPITLWGYERRLTPPNDQEIRQWLDEARQACARHPAR